MVRPSSKLCISAVLICTYLTVLISPITARLVLAAGVSVVSVSELDEERGECAIIGTLFKQQVLKPSILKEISEEVRHGTRCRSCELCGVSGSGGVFEMGHGVVKGMRCLDVGMTQIHPKCHIVTFVSPNMTYGDARLYDFKLLHLYALLKPTSRITSAVN